MKRREAYRKAIHRIKKAGSHKNKYKKVTQEDKEQNVEEWTAYWRANIHRFCKEYLEIKTLRYFQSIVLWLMNEFVVFVFIACRGLSKSFLTALFACARAILYPNEQIIIASGTKKQAKLIITEKIQKELMPMSMPLRMEIAKIVNNNNECKAIFKNGASIEAVTATDGSRGYRATILINDEYRLIEWRILTNILKPFLNMVRVVGFINKKEYKDYKPEQSKEIYLSSAWFKNSDMYAHFKRSFENMLKPDNNWYFTIDLNYELAIDEKITTWERIQREREDSGMSDIDFMLEYDGLFYGLSENAFFGLEDVTKNRILIRPLYPIDTRMIFPNDYSHVKKIPKSKNEIRVMGYDVAVMGGEKNDHAIMSILRLFPKENYYERHLVYMKHYHGMLTSEQAKTIKRIFYDLDCDYVALDCKGNGIGVYDALVLPIYDEITGLTFPAWTAFNDKELKKRAEIGAVEVIYGINATSALNHDIANTLRDVLGQGKLKLLMKDYEAVDYLTDNANYDSLSAERQAELVEPFIQTTLMQNELLNLEWELRGGYIRVSSTSDRKDRYSSIAYANILVKYLENKNLKRQRPKNSEDFFIIS